MLDTTVLFDFTGQSVYKCTFVYVTSSIVFPYVCVCGSIWMTCWMHKDVCTFCRMVSSMGTLCIHYTKSGLYCTFCTRHPCWDSFVEWTHQVYEHLYKQYGFHDWCMLPVFGYWYSFTTIFLWQVILFVVGFACSMYHGYGMLSMDFLYPWMYIV